MNHVVYGSILDLTSMFEILQHNGEVVHYSTYGPLTVEEHANLTIQQDIVTFKDSTEEHLGAKLAHNELEEDGIPGMPEYMPNNNKDQNKMTFPDLDEEVTPEVGDKYA